MRINSSPSAGSTIVDKLKIYEGGTGSTDAAAARTAFGLVAAADANQANGHAGLDGNGLLSASVIPDDGAAPISLQGPTVAVVNKTIAFVITNYDIFTTYSISATLGTVIQDKSNLYYTAGNTPGAGSITVNGRTVNLTVQAVQPNQPTLAVVDVGGTTAGTAALISTGSAFAMNTTSANTHLNSDWQIASDAAFTTIVQQSLADTTNKITWTAQGMGLSTTYYVRVRYRDSGGGVSDWSDTQTVTTKPSYTLSTEEAKPQPPADIPVNNDSYGSAVAIDSTGTRIVVGSLGRDTALTDVGTAYVFVRSGSTWSLEQKLAQSDPANSDKFGAAVDISADGTRLVIGTFYKASGQANAGCMYIFRRSGSTWTQEQKLQGDSPNVGNMFAYCVAIDDTGTRALSYEYQTGSVYCFLRTNTTWAKEASFVIPSVESGVHSMAIDSDATRVVVGTCEWNDGTFFGRGRAYVHKRTGATWAAEATLQSNEAAGGNAFGYSVAMDSTGTRVAVGANHTFLNSRGKLFIFLRTGTSWAQEAALSDTTTTVDANGRDLFGHACSITADGTRLVVAAISANNSQGRMFVYRRTGTSWAVQSNYVGSGIVSTDKFGSYVDVSKDGTRAIYGTQSSSTQPGQVFVYRD